MSQFVDWEYYSSLHTIVTEEAFERSEALAEKEIQRAIGWIRWAGITEDIFGFEQLKDCICNVMDKMAADARSGKGKGISSVSNDGYSESYVERDPCGNALWTFSGACQFRAPDDPVSGAGTHLPDGSYQPVLYGYHRDDDRMCASDCGEDDSPRPGDHGIADDHDDRGCVQPDDLFPAGVPSAEYEGVI